MIGRTLSEIVIPEIGKRKHKAGFATYLQSGTNKIFDKIIVLSIHLHTAGTKISVELLIRNLIQVKKETYHFKISIKTQK